MTVREFCLVGGLDLSWSLRKRLGLRAGQLFKEYMRGRLAPKRKVSGGGIVQPDHRRPWKEAQFKRHRENEFRSVVDAVRCAIEVQTGMVERNAGLPPERRIEFRVGIVTFAQYRHFLGNFCPTA
jgi:hypothetical protein